jgi:hypothetical protein
MQFAGKEFHLQWSFSLAQDILSSSIHSVLLDKTGQLYHRIDNFFLIYRQLAKDFHHPAPCIAPIQTPFRGLPAK